MQAWLQPHWPAPSHIKAYTFTREAGLTYSAADGELINRLVPLPSDPIWLRQIHSATVVQALPEHRYTQADASFTQQANQVCAVYTADCLPLLLCDATGTTVAAVHAGWRGLAQGIITATITQLPTPASQLFAWLGPAISQKNYTVGSEVLDQFVAKNSTNQQAFKANHDGTWQADLYHLARIELEQCAIKHIFGGEYCTYSDQEQFYSYRRDGKNTGRLVTLIWIAQD